MVSNFHITRSFYPSCLDGLAGCVASGWLGIARPGSGQALAADTRCGGLPPGGQSRCPGMPQSRPKSVCRASWLERGPAELAALTGLQLRYFGQRTDFDAVLSQAVC